MIKVPDIEKALSSGGLMIALLVVLAVMNIWNVAYTAVSNARKEKERQDAPVRDLENRLRDTQAGIRDLEGRFGEMCRDVNKRVDDLERGVVAHSDEIADLHAGQSALCRGVQALLEHALHNGNDEEMRDASNSIGKWLRTR